MPNYLQFIEGRYLGKVVHIVASGPSLIGFDYSKLSGKTIIAVNHAYKKVPRFDCKVAIDANFFQREDRDAVNRGITLCPAHACKDSNVINFRMSGMFSTEPGPVYGYGSAGLVALTIALQGGAEKVILWGYDYGFSNGAHHSTQGEFRHSMGLDKEHLYKNQVSKFAVYPSGIILNASPESNIPYFQKLSQSDALKY